MNLEIIIALAVGVFFIVVLLVLYAMGDLPRLKTIGRILAILGGVSSFYGAVLA